MRKILAATAVAMSLGYAAVASAEQPSCDWNCNWDFPSASEKQLLLNQADLIEFHENGGYETTINNYTTVGDTNIQCDASDGKFGGGCASDIENQSNATAIGSQTVTDQSNSSTIHVKGQDNTVSADQGNDASGNTARTQGDTGAESKITHNY